MPRAATAWVAIEIDETVVPARADVAVACELLGLDPLHVAKEWRLAAFVPASRAEAEQCRAAATR